MEDRSSVLAVSREAWRCREEDERKIVDVVSWNCLRKGYRFNGNTYTKDVHREWPHRVALLEGTLTKDVAGADFLCLQEIEQLSDLEHFLGTAYDVVVPSGKKKAGQHDFTKPRLYFLKARWELLWSECRSRVTLAGLRMRDSGRLFCVWNCHLQGGPLAAEDRGNQIKSATMHMKKHIAGMAYTTIIAGDFNTESIVDFGPEMGMTNVMAKHGINFGPTHCWGVGRDQFRSILDQIYTCQNLLTVAVRNPLTEEQWVAVREFGMPNAFNPSDHLPVVARFRFKEEE